MKGSSISCTAQLALKASNANVSIIGVKNSDGTYPVLDFSAFRSAYIGKATTDSEVGIRISGSNYTIKNLIIQKAPDNGIQIKGRAQATIRLKTASCVTTMMPGCRLQVVHIAIPCVLYTATEIVMSIHSAATQTACAEAWRRQGKCILRLLFMGKFR